MRNPFRKNPAHVAQAIEDSQVEQVRDGWASLYAQQSDMLEAVVHQLGEQANIIVLARNFMTVVAQRTHGDAALFVINEAAAPGEADMLRHAIVSLQAALEGTELPTMVAIDRVTH